MITLKDISKRYGRSPLVIDGITFTVERGAKIAITGPSGCGKSTLLNIAGLLDLPSGGVITIEGDRVSDMNEKRRATIRNRTIGFVFQHHHLLPQCTVMENVLLPTLAFRSRSGSDATRRARMLLDAAGLGTLDGRLPAQLSGGECQRVAVVRALINQPGLLLADEPTGSLDRTTAGQLVDLLLALCAAENMALIMVTHAPHLAARMDTVHELRDGRLEPAQ